MSTDSSANDLAWMPEQCTLATVDQPLRAAEFSALFATAVRGVDRRSPTLLRLLLDTTAEQDARELAARESGCCSFFTFTFGRGSAVEGEVVLDIEVPPANVAVADLLARRARTLQRADA